MARYPFLSDEWVAEAEKIRDQFRDSAPPLTASVRMNQIINDVPFGDGTIDAHLDTSAGELDLGLGHIDEADVTVTLDYDTAKAVFIEGSPQAGMQAFLAGKVVVQGDMTKLIEAMQQQQAAPPDEETRSIAERFREITE